jgi:hypothetical protein
MARDTLTLSFKVALKKARSMRTRACIERALSCVD